MYAKWVAYKFVSNIIKQKEKDFPCRVQIRYWNLYADLIEPAWLRKYVDGGSGNPQSWFLAYSLL